MSDTRNSTSRRGDHINPKGRRLFESIGRGHGSLEDEMSLVEEMAKDFPFHVWVLSKLDGQLEDGSARSAQPLTRLMKIMQHCNQYVLARMTDSPGEVTEAERRSMFLFDFLSAPLDSPPQYLHDQVQKAMNSNINVHRFLAELHDMRDLLTKSRQTTLPAWNLACERIRSRERIQAHVEFYGRSCPASGASSSSDHPIRTNPSSSRGPSTGNRVIGGKKHGTPLSVPISTSASSHHPQHALIDRVADRKATRAELAAFKKQVVSSSEVRQQVQDRMETYGMRSEDARCETLVEVLTDVNSTQCSRNESEEEKRISDRTAALVGSSVDSSGTKIRWEVQVAEQHRKAARQARKQSNAIERAGIVIPLDQVPFLIQEEVRTMYFRAMKLVGAQIHHYFPDLKSVPAKGCIADAIKAIRELHAEQGRLTQLQMLASFSGEAVVESTEKLIAMIARDMGNVTITAGPPAPQ